MSAEAPNALPWQKPDPDQELTVGDQLLVAIQVSRNSQHQRTTLLEKTWYWEYHVITVKEDGFDNSDGDSWCSWNWEDVQWYIHEKQLKPPED